MEKNKRKFNRKLNIQLIICMIALILILSKMYFFNNIFLIIAIFIMSLAIMMDKVENKPIYLFFALPFIYVMKFSNDQISLYNILVIVYLISMIYLYIKEKKKINCTPFIFLGLITVLIFINSLISKEFNIFSSVGWILNLIAFYFIIKNIKNEEVYAKYAYFFAISVAIVGISGIIFMNNTNISIYLDNMRRTNTIITDGKVNYRYCGFDLDPNYFAIQTLIAFWSILISNNKKRYILLIILLTVGLATVSKMYIITLILSTLFYIIVNIKNFKKVSLSLIIGTAIFITVLIIVANKYIMPVFETRFNSVENIYDLTTGRSEKWSNYIKYIMSNTKVLLIGQGMGIEYLDGYASHSTYILTIYRLGVLGTTFLIGFIIYTIKNMKMKVLTVYSIPLIVFMITNFALDILDFDSFAYLLVLILGIYVKKSNSEVKNEY